MSNSIAPTTSNASLNRFPMRLSIFTIPLLSTLTITAQAAPNDGVVGAYARVEVGRTHFGLSSALPLGGTDDRSSAVKVFGGYRFNENYGVEGGYAALGSFSTNVNIGGVTARQDGRARSLFGAATGRLPLGESVALQGRLGVSFGKVSGTNALPESHHFVGSASSLLAGVGAEYKPRPNVALTVNYDSYGRLASNVKAGSLVFGVHFWF